MTTPGLGYLYTHPDAIAARTNPLNWDLGVLLASAATVPVPDEFDTDLGPVLDQGGLGACVAFGASAIRNHQEHLDEGGWPMSTASAFVAYNWLKHGHGSWPGDGAPDIEGSWPSAVWTMARQVGVPGTDGKGRLIEAYYQLRGVPGSEEWIDQQIQLLLSFGPFSVSSPWPGNWWSCPKSGLLPAPRGVVGGHLYGRKGFTLKGPIGPLSGGMSPTGRYFRQRQSWGAYGATDKFGRGGMFLLPFEGDRDFLQIGEAWKSVDRRDAPIPPAPTPEGPMLTLVDKIARTVDSAVGKQLWRADGTTKLVPLSSGVLGLASPARYANAAGVGYYSVVISSGGVPQLAWIRMTDAFNVKVVAADPAAEDAAHNEGLDKALAAVLAIPRR